MTFISKILLSSLAICFCSLNYIAQDTTKSDLPGLDELTQIKVYSATKTHQEVPEAPANIWVITDKQIQQRGYRTLEEVMKDLPGFDFSVGQPSGEYPTHFRFRGIGDIGQTKFVIMVDGIPQNDISNGWARNIGFNFTLTDVERIEFVSGPGSALYGLNAYAGFINVITKSKNEVIEKNELETKVSMNYGSFNSINPEVYTSFKSKSGIALQLTAKLFWSEGDKGLNRPDPGNYFHNNFEPDSVLTLEHGLIANDSIKPLNDGYNNSILDYYIRGKMTEGNFTLAFNFWSRNEGIGSEVVGYEYFTNTDGIDYQVAHSGKTISTRYNYDFSDKIKSTSKAYFVNTSVLPTTGFTYTYQYQSVDNGINSPVRNRKKSYNSEGFLFGIEQQLSFKIGTKNQLVTAIQAEQKVREYFNISVDARQDRNSNISSKPGEPSQFQPVYYSKNGAFLLQDEHQFTENLKLTLGARYDMDELFGNVLNPRVAIVSSNANGFGFKAMYSHGFKAPTIFELQDEWRGNEDLTPERVQTSEIELSYRQKKRGVFQLNIFHNHLKNLIIVAPNPDTTIVQIGENGEKTNYYQNLGSTDIIGLSLNTNYRITKSFNIFGNYQFLSHADGSLIDNVAAHKLNIGFNFHRENLGNINLRANMVSKTKAPITNRFYHSKTPESIQEVGYDYVTEDNPDGFSDGFIVLNLAIQSRDLIKSNKFSLVPSILIKNLTNKQYVQMGRQSGDGTRPIDALQPYVRNPVGFIPAYHPQAGIEIFGGITFGF